MDITINLVHNKGFFWVNNKTIFFKGFIVYNGTYYEGAKALLFFESYSNLDKIKEEMHLINGLFSLIINRMDYLLIIVDRVRTFPLFYQAEKCITVTDDPYSFTNKTLNKRNIDEFLLTGFTTENKTLLTNVYQTRPSEILLFNDEGITRTPYFTYKTKHLSSKSFYSLADSFEQLLFASFKEFIKTLNNRPVAISLSGGYDSRLIAFMLSHFGYEKVFCFTFGRENNEELENSRKTAETLGFTWRFINYKENLVSNYIKSPIFQEYIQFSGRLSSMPYLQEYFAVKYIRDFKLVEKDTLFILGHLGDFLGGSQLKGIFKLRDGILKVIKTIYYSNYNNSRLPNRKSFLIDLKRTMHKEQQFSYSLFEDWYLREKTAKLIVNSASVFDFFGYEYRLPFLDIRLLSFFKEAPLKFKNYKILYYFVLKRLFSQKDLNYVNELQATKMEIFLQRKKEYIKRHLPVRIIKKYKNNKPWNSYDILTRPMLDNLKEPYLKKQLSENYNSIICHWYIEDLKIKKL